MLDKQRTTTAVVRIRYALSSENKQDALRLLKSLFNQLESLHDQASEKDKPAYIDPIFELANCIDSVDEEKWEQARSDFQKVTTALEKIK